MEEPDAEREAAPEGEATPETPPSPPTASGAPVGVVATLQAALRNIAFLRTTYRPYRRWLVITCGLLSLQSMFEGAVLACLVPAFAFITGEAAEPTSSLGQGLRAALEAVGLSWSFGSIFLVIVLLSLARAVTRIAGDILAARSVASLMRELRGRVFRSLLETSWPYFTRQRMGDLIALGWSETGKTGALFRTLILLYNMAFAALCYAVIAAWIAPGVTAAALGLAGATTLLLMPLYGRGKAVGRRSVSTGKNAHQVLTGLLVGWKAVKASAIEEQAATLFDRRLDAVEQVDVARGRVNALIASVFEPAVVLFVIAFVWGMRAAFEVSLAEASVIGLLLYRIYQQVSAIQRSFGNLALAVGGVEMVTEFERELGGAREPRGATPAPPLQRAVLDRVEFAYERDQPVLRGVSLEVAAGELVGIVGESGAGKSTVADILLGLLPPDRGRVTINGRDLAELDVRSWRQRVGYVGQETILFDASIHDNVALFDDSVTREDVVRAAGLAAADAFVTGFPEGYETLVGDRGTRLSGGERQRIALARALLRRPELLVLDEATSSLDGASERAVLDALDGLRSELAIVSVAHRLSSVAAADRIVVLAEGRVVQSGPPEELLREEGPFRRLHDLQGGAGAPVDAGDAQDRRG